MITLAPQGFSCPLVSEILRSERVEKLPHDGCSIAAPPVNDFQRIDVAALRKATHHYIKTHPVEPTGLCVQLLELLDLVQETRFLEDIEMSRRVTAALEDAAAEDILPGAWRSS